MTRYLTILAVTMAVACSGGDDPGDTGAGGDEPGGCDNSISSQSPEAESTDIFYKSDIRVILKNEDPAATIVITDADGAEVNGSSTVDGANVIWSGDDLKPLTSYTVTVNYECGPTTYGLTTSNVGTPVGSVDLTNRVYSLDIAKGDWIEPRDVGSLLATQLGGIQIFASPSEVTASNITMIGGIGDDDGQDLCSPTIPFPPATWTDPFFQLAAPQLLLQVAGIDVNITGLDLSGAFAPDGTLIQGTSLKGAIDTRVLVPVLSPGGEDNAVCLLVEAVSDPCQECEDGSGPFCVSVWVSDIPATEVAGATLVPRTDADIDADPSCAQ